MKIEAKGLPEVEKNMRERMRRMQDFTPVMRVAAEAVMKLVDDSFRDQRSPSGTPWAPLSGVTVYRRIARKKSGDRVTYSMRRVVNRSGELTARAATAMAPGGTKALTDTGRLRRGIFAKAERRAFTFGASRVPYAAAQNFGNPDNKMFGKVPAPIPARPFLPVERSGRTLTLMRSGRAAAVWREIFKAVAAYVATGKVQGV